MAEHCCAACRTPFLNARPLNEQGLCRLCAAGFTRFDAAYSYGDYHGGLRGLIHLFKYGCMRPLAAPLGRMLSAALPRDQVFDAIVPMPLHWRKLLVRGFNQSRLLAVELSRRTGIPTEPLLRRRRHTSAQAGLSGAQRRANVAGAFGASPSVRGRRLLLIDDVFTTGATVNAAAGALKQAGAARVAVLTLARTDRLQRIQPLPFDTPPDRGATE
ncbi:MAG: ComF family protein [Candidatus Solibacter usitatus]|nr:ComF family protein [Candidatus Solibacter usitatus]